MREDRWRKAGVLAILTLVPSLLFLDVLLGTNGFYLRDLSQYYFPAKRILREIVLGGEFPYWNPWFSAGQPMAANPEFEVFYPLTWLILLPDYVLSFQFLALLHIFIATFSMYALLRSMELGRPASCFGALSFGVGGLVCSLVVLLPCLFSIAWLPLTCLFARRFLIDRRATALAGAAISLGMQLLVGEPITALQSGLLLGCYAIYRGYRERGWRTALQRVRDIALISILALLLAAVQVLPAFDHLRDSGRGHSGIAYGVSRMWSTPPIRFAESLYPNLLGRVDSDGTPAYWGSWLYSEKGTPFYYSIYCGLAVAVLAIAGLFARIRGWPLFVILIAISYIVAAGDNTPLWRALYDLDIARSVRYPEKFLLLGVFATIVFSAHVLESLLRLHEPTRKAAVIATIGVSSVALLAAASSTSSAHASLFRALFHIDPRLSIEASLAMAQNHWLVAGLRGVLLLLLVRGVGWERRRLWLILFGAFVSVDLASQTPDVAPRVPLTFYREVPAAAQRFPANRDEFRIFHLADWQTGSAGERMYLKRSPVVYWISRNALFPRQPASYGLQTVIDGDFDETNLQAERDFSASVWELAASRPRDYLNTVMAMSNAWYLGAYRNPTSAVQSAGGWNRHLEPVRFIEGPHHPRYYFATQIISIRDRKDFVLHLQTLRYSRQAAFVHEPAFPTATGVVRSVRQRSNGARIDVEAAGRAFLVMSVTPHKYWRITIDGKETQGLVANIGYQGVVVPAGRHTVEMRYRNPLVVVGGALSSVTLLLLLLRIRRPLPAR